MKRKTSRLSAVTLSLTALLLFLIACGGQPDGNAGGDTGGPLVITIAGPDTVVAGQSAELTATITGDGAAEATVSWSATGGQLSDETGLSTTWTAPTGPGEFTVTASLAPGSNDISASHTITATAVEPDPEEPTDPENPTGPGDPGDPEDPTDPEEPIGLAVVIDAPVELGGGSSTVLTATYTGEGAQPDDISWSADGGTFSNDTGTVTTWTAPIYADTYQVRAILTVNGHSVEDEVQVVVSESPLTVTITESVTRGRIGSEYDFAVQVEGPGAEQAIVSWRANGGSFEQPSGTHTTWTAPGDVGQFTVTAEVTGTSARDSVGVQTYFCESGVGTSLDNPCPISNVLQLQAMELTGHYTLTNDIDASDTAEWGNSNEGFLPIGPTFEGSLNGNGHAIHSLYINRPDETSVGLFRTIGDSADISNLTLTDVSVTGHNQVGGLSAENDGSILYTHVTGAVSTTGTSTGTASRVGGLVGINNGSITESSTSVTVTSAGGAAGGLAGRNFRDGEIARSHASGPIVEDLHDYTGPNYIANVGGLVGENYGLIEESYSTVGQVKSSGTSIGGLAGSNEQSGEIERSFTDSSMLTISGRNSVGGLVGANRGSIHQSYSQALSLSVTYTNAGGIAGMHNGTGAVISESYSTTFVPAVQSSGGVIGYFVLNGDAVVEDSFWNYETSEQPDAKGVDGVTGLSSVEMLNPINFADAGWIMTSTWVLEQDTLFGPELRWHRQPRR